jgi:hypothetical protein
MLVTLESGTSKSSFILTASETVWQTWISLFLCKDWVDRGVCGLDCGLPKIHVLVLTANPVNGILFGKRLFVGVVKLRILRQNHPELPRWIPSPVQGEKVVRPGRQSME